MGGGYTGSRPVADIGTFVAPSYGLLLPACVIAKLLVQCFLPASAIGKLFHFPLIDFLIVASSTTYLIHNSIRDPDASGPLTSACLCVCFCRRRSPGSKQPSATDFGRDSLKSGVCGSAGSETSASVIIVGCRILTPKDSGKLFFFPFFPFSHFSHLFSHSRVFHYLSYS